MNPNAISAVPPRHRARLREARDHLARGQPLVAAEILRELAAEAPDLPLPWVELGRAHQALGRMSEALDQVSRGIGLEPDPPLQWRLLQARLLSDLGREAEAADALRPALARHPDAHNARLLLGNLLRISGASEEALALLDAVPVDAYGPDSRILVVRAHTLWRLERFAEARATLGVSVERSTTALTLSKHFEAAPTFFGEDAPYEELVTRIERRLAKLSAEEKNGEDGRLLTTRLHYGMCRIGPFRAHAVRLLAEGYQGHLAPVLRGVVREIERSPEERHARPKVFVIGLSKTATTSLNGALEMLGYNAQHWSSVIDNQFLRPRDAEFYDALSDVTISAIYDLLAKRYPQARFILTERPIDAWHESIVRWNRSKFDVDDLDGLRRKYQRLEADGHHPRYCRVGRCLYTRYRDYPEAYRAHEAEVAAFFSDQPGRLLRFNPFQGDGWAKLCAFLDRPVPPGSFPRENVSRPAA